MKQEIKKIMSIDEEWSKYCEKEGLKELIQIFDSQGCLVEIIFDNERIEIPEFLRGKPLISYFPFSEESKKPIFFLEKSVLTLEQFNSRFK